MPSMGRTMAYLWCLLIFGVCGILSSQDDRPCDGKRTVDFIQCHRNETCFKLDSENSVCRCSRNYQRIQDGTCQPVSQDSVPSPPSHTVTPSDSGGFGFKLLLWLALPVLLAGLIGVIVYTGRQKMWLNRLYRMRVRSYNNVLSTRPV